MAQWVRQFADKPDDLSWIPDHKVEETWFLQVVLWPPPHTCFCICAHITFLHTHSHTINVINFLNKLILSFNHYFCLSVCSYMEFCCIPSLAASSRHLELGYSPASVSRVLSYRHVQPCQDPWRYIMFSNLIFPSKTDNHLAKGWPWLLYPLASTSQVLGWQVCPSYDLCGAGAWTQGPREC